MKKIKNKNKFITGILLIVFSIMFVSISIIGENILQSSDFIEKKVPCYDSNHNKIIGETCIKKVFDNNLNYIYILTLIICLTMLLMLLMNLIFSEGETNFFGIKYKKTK